MKQIKRRYIAALLCCCSALYGAAAAYAASDLPELGTAALNTLSIEQENVLGDAYMRILRQQLPIITDPVMNEYLSDVGNRLVAHSNNVKTPFEFFLINNNDINAFAFFGGHVGVHTALFVYAKNEGELASVLAHEVAHVTQRHLARSIEAQKKNSPATVAGVLGSILIALAAPEAGIAALQSTLALGQQAQINYTRMNEQEADRIGMKTLVASGYDPNSFPSFFGTLAAQTRFTSKPPAILLTHPLPESRISDSRNRAARYPARHVEDSLMFRLAKARVQVRYSNISNEHAVDVFQRQLKEVDQRFRAASEYGLALTYFEMKQFDKAESLIRKLLATDPQNLFYLDTFADVMLETKQFNEVISTLEKVRKDRPNNTVIEINLANAYLTKGEYRTSKRLLERQRSRNPDNSTVYSLLSTVYARLDSPDKRHMAQAELMALRADYTRGIDELQRAYRQTSENPLQMARIDARIKQMRLAQQQLNQLK